MFSYGIYCGVGLWYFSTFRPLFAIHAERGIFCLIILLQIFNSFIMF